MTQQLIAHQVQLTDEVGATLHIEPNDNPRAGEPTTAWFAIARQGGVTIPLTECVCQLAVYSSPRTDAPILTPVLTPLSAEGYENIPSAELTFPDVGSYKLVLTGAAAADTETFAPFELTFEVLVAAGQSVSEAVGQPETATDTASQTTESQIQPDAYGEPVSLMPIFLGIGVAVALGVAGLAMLANLLVRRSRS